MPTESGKQRGPKPKYGKPMTAAERKRLSRQKLSQEGGSEYMVKIEGSHMKAISALAKVSGEDKKHVLKFLFSNALDRVVGVMNRAAYMEELGATDNEIALFMRQHLHPDLPSKDELKQEVPRQ